ncbi:MAG: peptidylprolyl isomerase [Alphaproteobacteria bacterium]|nr:peptidylprolyl isomerase [Alphaproteobacteria bacterium]MCD8526514.1 peptidylprolyl isomerase [Alphaproteobacteria bacterium]MCD8570346.1 peptidylprolyl isomerase [Alphaproteobacteria bacterium]
MKKSLYLTVLALCALGVSFASSAALAGLSENIAVVVNNQAISQSDVNDRMRLIMVSSGLQDTPEIREKLIPQITSVLIDEQLRLQEGEKIEAEITQEQIDAGFKQIADQNKMSPDQFKQVLKQSGINVATMERQIRSQIAWTKVMQAKIKPKIQVRETDVEDAIERMRANIGKTEYLAAEIFLPVDIPADEANVRQLASRLSSEIKSGKAPFFQVARQFSQSAGASRGGDIGWVQEDQLAPEVAETMAKLDLNQVSAPVRSLSGYHIVLLREKREIKEENIPGKQAMINLIGTERLERMQRQYFLDLKTAAFIDSRV